MTAIRFAATTLLVPLAAFAQVPAGWAEFTKTFQAYADSDQVVGASVETALDLLR